jgi:hypothetical protein
MPSASTASVTAWLHPSWVLMCQPVNRRRPVAADVPVVGMALLLLFWWLLCGGRGWWPWGRQAAGPVMAINARHDQDHVLPKQ